MTLVREEIKRLRDTEIGLTKSLYLSISQSLSYLLRPQFRDRLGLKAAVFDEQFPLVVAQIKIADIFPVIL
jgi:hypothetical protein